MQGFDSLCQTFGGYAPNEDKDLVPFVELELRVRTIGTTHTDDENDADCEACAATEVLRFCCDPQDLRRLHTGLGQVLDDLPPCITFIKKAPSDPGEEAPMQPNQPSPLNERLAQPNVRRSRRATPEMEQAAIGGRAFRARMAAQNRSTITDILKNIALEYGLPALEEVLHDFLANGQDATTKASMANPAKANPIGA